MGSFSYLMSCLLHINLFVVTDKAENPAYDEIRQKQLFCENKPLRPPRRETDEYMMLQAFCSEITFILQVVIENKYQAAVTLMKPPANTPFTKAVVFPRPGTVIGMFADKKTALIFINEGSDYKDYMQDAIDSFPNTRYVISVGECFAFDSEKHKLGDVLVSKQIYDFKLGIKNGRERILGEQIVNVVEDLASLLCKDLTHEEDFVVSDTRRCSKVDTGKFVSIPIFNSKDTRKEIHCLLPEAIGGDMEGRQLLALLKGVSHYADGHRAEEWEFTASLAALHYLESKLYYYQGKSELRILLTQHARSKLRFPVPSWGDESTHCECNNLTLFVVSFKIHQYLGLYGWRLWWFLSVYLSTY